MAKGSIQLRDTTVRGRPARVYVGGQGPALLLIHGGWGGATHWSQVMPALCAEHQVIAPHLPGLGWLQSEPLPSVADYAAWLLALLQRLDVDRATLVGNSFGASVAWSLAGRFPHACAGLVLVNGIPMPATPALLLRAGKTRLGASVMRRGVRRLSYNPDMLTRAFVNPELAPEDMRAMLSDPKHPMIARFAALLIAGDGAPTPQQAPLLLWGARDGLPGTRISDARRLLSKLPGASLCAIPGAGHFPQLEAPDRFTAELLQWLRRRAPSAPRVAAVR